METEDLSGLDSGEVRFHGRKQSLKAETHMKLDQVNNPIYNIDNTYTIWLFNIAMENHNV